jgi:hypothetical protein
VGRSKVLPSKPTATRQKLRSWVELSCFWRLCKNTAGTGKLTANVAGRLKAWPLIRTSIESILATLRQHAYNADVLDKGFGALESLAARSEVNKVKLGELGAVDVLLNAMQLHLGLANIQRRVCGTFESLAT